MIQFEISYRQFVDIVEKIDLLETHQLQKEVYEILQKLEVDDFIITNLPAESRTRAEDWLYNNLT